MPTPLIADPEENGKAEILIIDPGKITFVGLKPADNVIFYFLPDNFGNTACPIGYIDPDIIVELRLEDEFFRHFEFISSRSLKFSIFEKLLNINIPYDANNNMHYMWPLGRLLGTQLESLTFTDIGKEIEVKAVLQYTSDPARKFTIVTYRGWKEYNDDELESMLIKSK